MDKPKPRLKNDKTSDNTNSPPRPVIKPKSEILTDDAVPAMGLTDKYPQDPKNTIYSLVELDRGGKIKPGGIRVDYEKQGIANDGQKKAPELTPEDSIKSFLDPYGQSSEKHVALLADIAQANPENPEIPNILVNYAIKIAQAKRDGQDYKYYKKYTEGGKKQIELLDPLFPALHLHDRMSNIKLHMADRKEYLEVRQSPDTTLLYGENTHIAVNMNTGECSLYDCSPADKTQNTEPVASSFVLRALKEQAREPLYAYSELQEQEKQAASQKIFGEQEERKKFVEKGLSFSREDMDAAVERYREEPSEKNREVVTGYQEEIYKIIEVMWQIQEFDRKRKTSERHGHMPVESGGGNEKEIIAMFALAHDLENEMNVRDLANKMDKALQGKELSFSSEDLIEAFTNYKDAQSNQQRTELEVRINAYRKEFGEMTSTLEDYFPGNIYSPSKPLRTAIAKLSPDQEVRVIVPDKVAEHLHLLDQMLPLEKNMHFCKQVIEAQKTIEGPAKDFMPLLKDRSLEDKALISELEKFIKLAEAVSEEEKRWTLKHKPAQTTPALNGEFLPEITASTRLIHYREDERNGTAPIRWEDERKEMFNWKGAEAVSYVRTETFYLYVAEAITQDGKTSYRGGEMLTLEEVKQKPGVTMEPWLPESVQWYHKYDKEQGRLLCTEPVPEKQKVFFRLHKGTIEPRQKEPADAQPVPESFTVEPNLNSRHNEETKNQYYQIDGELTEANARENAVDLKGTHMNVGAKPEDKAQLQEQYERLLKQRQEFVRAKYTNKDNKSKSHNI